MKRCSFNYWSWVVVFVAAFLMRPGTVDGALGKSMILENNVGYLLVTETGTNLAEEMQSAFDGLSATNSIVGIVLDLRFAKGDDAESLKSAGSFLEEKKLPLAILVNAQTKGAAAQLAEDLRDANIGLIFGSPAMSLQPDISVSTSANDERSFLKNPYGVFGGSYTNSDSNTNFLPYVDVDHTSEADLVREKIKDGDENETATPAVEQTTPQKTFIRDPVLARGVDFIKGVAALHLSKR